MLKKKTVLRAARFLITAGVVAGLSAGAYYLVQVRHLTMPALFTPPPGPRLLISMAGFRVAQSEDGRVTWRASARTADLYENKEAVLQDIEILFTDPGKGETALRGEKGTIDTTSGNASVRGVSREVRVATSDGYLLTTNSLTWKAGDRLVKTADPFKLLGPDLYLEGRGVVANVNLRRMTVEKDVKAVFQE